MEELENLVPQGPKRRESEPTVDDSNLQKTYDSYKPSKPPASKPSYDSYKPRNQPSVHSRRRPTAEEYWDQRLSPVSFTPPEHKSSAPSLGGSRRPSEALLATPGDSNFTRKDQDHTHGVGLEQRAANRSCVMDVDSPDPGLPKRSKADDLHVNTELTKTFGSKSNNSKTQIPTAVTETRLTPHEGSGLASTSLSGHATPQSASMEIDTPISGHIQAGGKTTAGTVIKSFSFPTPHARGSNESEKDTTKRVSKTLSFFAHSVTETASSTIKRDMALSKSIKTERESKKWQNLQADYASLAEAQAKAVKTLKDAADRVDGKLLKFKQAQDEAVKAMAATMVSVNSGTTNPAVRPDNSKVKVLEAEVKELKDAVKAINSSLEASKNEQGRSKSGDSVSSRQSTEVQVIGIDPENPRDQLGQIGGFQTILSRGDNRISSLESNSEKFERSHATIAQVQHIQEQFAGFQAQLNSTKVTKNNLSDLEAKVSSLTESLQVLNEEVIGISKNDPGNNHKSRITRLQEDMAEFTRELGAQMEKTHLQINHVASLATTGNSDVSQRLETSTAEIAQVAKDLAAVVSDQKDKDELVAQEVERLDQTIVAMQADLVKMRADLFETRTKLQPPDTIASSTQALTNGAHFIQPQHPSANKMSPQYGTTSANPSYTQSKLLDDYNDRLVVCETVFLNLQQRFDNLSTAELARNMVHQMSAMYPYPAQVLAQLEQLGRNYNTLVQTVANLSGNYGTLSRRLDSIAQTPIALQDAANRQVLVTIHDEKIKSLEARFTALSQRSATPGNSAELATKIAMDQKSASLDEQLSALKADLKENSLGLKDINKVLDIATDQYQSTVASLQSDLQKIREALNQKFSVAEHDTFNALVETHVKGINKRLDEKEDVTVLELSKMHEEVTAVMKYLGMPYRGESQEPDDKNDDQIASEPVATSASPAVTLGPIDDSMSEDSDPVYRPLLGRSILTKKKPEHKRKRHSRGSESEATPRRKLKSDQ